MNNSIVLIGRLTKDPEVRFNNNGLAIAKFTVAVDRFKKGETDFINIVAFRKTAELAGEFLKKGKLVSLRGRLVIDKVEKDGTFNYYTSVTADEFKMLDKKEETNSSNDKPSSLIDDDNIPF